MRKLNTLNSQPAVAAIIQAKRKTSVARNTLNGVTGKQEQFIQNVINGMTYSDAYRNAYDISPTTKPATIAVSASKLMSKPNIQSRLRQLELEKEEQRRMAGLTMQHRVIERLEREASDVKNPASVRVRALELLGKIAGVFKENEKDDDDKPQTVEQMESRLRDLLNSRTG